MMAKQTSYESHLKYAKNEAMTVYCRGSNAQLLKGLTLNSESLDLKANSNTYYLSGLRTII